MGERPEEPEPQKERNMKSRRAGAGKRYFWGYPSRRTGGCGIIVPREIKKK